MQMNTCVFVAAVKAILKIPFYGATNRGELTSNLMVPPSLQIDLQQVVVVQLFEQTVL